MKEINGLASEILHELRVESRRRFILLIITISLLFASNIAWLVAWNLPDDTITESYELDGDSGASVIYNEMGSNSKLSNEVKTNEQGTGDEDKDIQTK